MLRRIVKTVKTVERDKASLLRLCGVLAASNSLVVAVPGAVFAPGVVSFGGVPIMGGISRVLCSGRGGGSNQGATAMAGRASVGCLVWVAKHSQLVLLDPGQTLVLLCSVVPVHDGASVKFSLSGKILLATEILGDPYAKKSPLPRIGPITCLPVFPEHS
jgi:hypothetical protein